MVTFLVNFLYIFAAMALFFVPFVCVFAWRHKREIEASQPHFNYFMEKFFASRESNYLVMTWAAAEAIFWFIIPEFLLVLMVFMKVKGKINLVKYDIYGTIIGTLIALYLHLPQQTMLKIPYIQQGMIDQVHFWYQQHGILGIFYQPFSGVPYKVFNHAAPDYQFFIPLFLVLAIVARMARYIIIYEFAKALFPVLHPFVRKHYGYLFVVAIALFTISLMRVVDIYAPGYIPH